MRTVSGVAPFDSDIDRPRGWKYVQKNIPKIIEYGRSEGILQPREAGTLAGFVQIVQEEAQHVKEKRSVDKVNLPTNDINLIHEAIPFLPFPIACTCLIFNIFIPGLGTVLSGIATLFCGQPRVHFKEGRKLATLIINLLVGISQFFTITFLLVGWFWSIAWGGLMIIHASVLLPIIIVLNSFLEQYREALQQRRQEVVATAAIEALTKDSILHRRDVKTLLKTQKENDQLKIKAELDAKQKLKLAKVTSKISSVTTFKKAADGAAKKSKEQNGHVN